MCDNIYNVGYFFKNFFDSEQDYFNLIENSHHFQSLTESNKSGSAYRKGIYLTKVEKNNDHVKFNLLRCSTNLDGPTDNLREIDNYIIEKVNKASKECFKDEIPAELNHVLAQIYNNVVTENKKEKKQQLNNILTKQKICRKMD